MVLTIGNQSIPPRAVGTLAKPMISNMFFVTRKKCPACGGINISNLVSVPYSSPEIRKYLTDFYASTGGPDYKYLESANFAIEKCADCSLIFQREVPAKKLSELLYEKWVDKELTRSRQQNKDLDYFLCQAQEIVSIIEYFNKTPSLLKFLDFGMGWGNWCRMARGFGCQADGMELSKERIIAARESGIKIISWNNLRKSNYDFINADRVFEHLPEPLETLKSLTNALNENGIIKINVPDGANILTAISHWDWTATRGSPLSLNAISPLEHINCFNKKSLLTMAEKAGLEPVNLVKSQNIIASSATSWADNPTASAKYWGDTFQFFKKTAKFS